MKDILKKIEARCMAGEADGGSEIVQTVIVLGFALGLGGALMLLQGDIRTTLKNAGDGINTFFGSLTSGMS